MENTGYGYIEFRKKKKKTLEHNAENFVKFESSSFATFPYPAIYVTISQHRLEFKGFFKGEIGFPILRDKIKFPSSSSAIRNSRKIA